MHRRWGGGDRTSISRFITSFWRSASPPSKGSDAARRNPAGGTHRCDAAQLVTRSGSTVAASAARHGDGGGSDVVAELGDITRFAKPNSSWRISAWFHQHSSGNTRRPGRDYQGEQRCGATSADRGGLELGSRPGSAESNSCGRRAWPNRSATPLGRRKSGCAVDDIASLSGPESCRDGGDRRDSRELAGQGLGDRTTGAYRQQLLMRWWPLSAKPKEVTFRKEDAAQSWGKAGEARSRPGEPSFPLPAGAHPTLVARQEAAPRRITGPAETNPRIRA